MCQRTVGFPEMLLGELGEESLQYAGVCHVFWLMTSSLFPTKKNKFRLVQLPSSSVRHLADVSTAEGVTRPPSLLHMHFKARFFHLGTQKCGKREQKCLPYMKRVRFSLWDKILHIVCTFKGVKCSLKLEGTFLSSLSVKIGKLCFSEYAKPGTSEPTKAHP